MSRAPKMIFRRVETDFGEANARSALGNAVQAVLLSDCFQTY
jgi:hypothetical protein